jgi:hypothetical protein
LRYPSACYTWLESSESLVSHATNRTSFGAELSVITNLVEAAQAACAARELQKTPQMLHQDDLSHDVISARFYTYLGGMFLVYISMYSTN